MKHFALKRMYLLTAWRRIRLSCRLSGNTNEKNGRNCTDQDVKGNLHGYVSVMGFLRLGVDHDFEAAVNHALRVEGHRLRIHHLR